VVAVDELVDPLLYIVDSPLAGWDCLGHVEDLPVGGLHLLLGVLGHLGQQVSTPMNDAALPQTVTIVPLHRRDQPGGAVADDQQRRPQPPVGLPLVACV
jgi:hypothetical protein